MFEEFGIVLVACISLEKFRGRTLSMENIPTLSYKQKRLMILWKTNALAHSKSPSLLFSTTVLSFIPKNTFARMLAALCDTSQIHLYGSTCSQHNHPSPLCTFDADLSNCRKKNLNTITHKSTWKKKNMIRDIMHQSMIKDHHTRGSSY